MTEPPIPVSYLHTYYELTFLREVYGIVHSSIGPLVLGIISATLNGLTNVAVD